MNSDTPLNFAARITAPVLRVVYSRWVGVAMVSGLVLGSLLWFATRERLPRSIAVATGAPNGQYHRCGEFLAQAIEQRTGRRCQVLVTEGSVDNRQRLMRGEAQLAIIQNGTIAMDGLTVIAPLFPDVVHMVVRKGRGIQKIRDLIGKNVALGPMGSGMHASAVDILSHYGVSEDRLGGNSQAYFRNLEQDDSLDAAIVTTAYVNQDLKDLLGHAEFELLDIENREAISILKSHLSPTTIPRGLYREGPAVPATPKQSLATTSLLVAREGVADELVRAAVAALYEDYPHAPLEDANQMARFFSKDQASRWQQLPLHTITETYFEPYKGLILLKDFMESMVATKELLFTLGAGVYVLWLWRSKLIARRNAQALAVHMRRLETLLDETIRIEAKQMETDDPQELRKYFDEVTRIKLRALDELTDEALRGDQMFAIFLTQCSNLSRKLQLKLSMASQSNGP